mgnify:CR=1 FL=1
MRRGRARCTALLVSAKFRLSAALWLSSRLPSAALTAKRAESHLDACRTHPPPPPDSNHVYVSRSHLVRTRAAEPINHPETSPSSLVGALGTAPDATRIREPDLPRSHPQAESSPSSSRPRTMSRPSLPRVYSSSSTAGQSRSPSFARANHTAPNRSRADALRRPRPPPPRRRDFLLFYPHLETPTAGRMHAVSSRADRKVASTSARATAWSATCSTQRA